MAATEVKVPDIGDFHDVPVIEVLVKAGDTVQKDDSLVVLESDKATMEVPAPAAGTVKEVRIKVGDKVSQGTAILLMEGAGPSPQPAASAGATPGTKAEGAAAPPPTAAPEKPAPAPQKGGGAITPPTPTRADAPGQVPPPPPRAPASAAPAAPATQAGEDHHAPAHASPGVRRFARELGVEIGRVQGSGPKGRILKEDVQGFVKSALAGGAAAAPSAAGGGLAGLGLPAWPQVDFAKYGPVERQELPRIKKISGPALARNWVMIPHVTQFDEADVTDLEAFRGKLNEENAKSGVKVTPLAFLIKAVVAALKKFPQFNSSLDGDALVVKQYWNIGFAADTPQGLVVPVVKNADQKGVIEIAQESSALAAKAREGKLGPADMQGGTFSISSLGGIGGTAFTPIVNAPEVAILGVSRTVMKPVWNGREFVPRLMLPLSLSYDHRVIDGASGARFTAYLAQVIGDMRRAML